jgi:hypothetical protein
MRFFQYVLLALSVTATCMTLPVRAQSSTDAAPADPARAASEAPAPVVATATAPVSATPAAPTGPAAPTNPTSATSAPDGVATPTAAATQAPATAQAAATAQAPAATTQSPAAAPSTANSTASKISPDVIKRAKDLGLHAETKKGVTRYCKIDVPIGTRFPTKSCYDEDTLPMMVDQIEYQKSLMRRGSSCGGGGGCATP